MEAEAALDEEEEEPEVMDADDQYMEDLGETVAAEAAEEAEAEERGSRRARDECARVRVDAAHTHQQCMSSSLCVGSAGVLSCRHACHSRALKEGIARMIARRGGARGAGMLRSHICIAQTPSCGLSVARPCVLKARGRLCKSIVSLSLGLSRSARMSSAAARWRAGGLRAGVFTDRLRTVDRSFSYILFRGARL